jgi:hypothetical protein
MSASEASNHEAGGDERREVEERLEQAPDEWYAVPLFLRDSSDGRKGNAQDEKDEMGE